MVKPNRLTNTIINILKCMHIKIKGYGDRRSEIGNVECIDPSICDLIATSKHVAKISSGRQNNLSIINKLLHNFVLWRAFRIILYGRKADFGRSQEVPANDVIKLLITQAWLAFYDVLWV